MQFQYIRSWFFSAVCCLVVPSAFATTALVVPAVGDETELLVSDCELSISRHDTYETQMAKARAILRHGELLDDSELRARGMIRLAFIEIFTGRWGPKWAGWRDEAVELTKDLPHPNTAKAEVETYNAYLRGVYFEELGQGVADARQAIAALDAMENDLLLARAHYFLSRLLIFEGQDIGAIESMRLSALFAQRIDRPHLEYFSTINLFAFMESLDLPVEGALRKRLQYLCEKLGHETEHLLSGEEKTLWLKEKVKLFDEIKDQPPTLVTRELRLCLTVAKTLSRQFADANDWDAAQKYAEIYRVCAERTQNSTSILEARCLEAGIKARLGDTEDLNECGRALIDRYKELSVNNDVAYYSNWITEQFIAGGDVEAAAEWAAMVEQYRDDSLFSKMSASAAESRFDSILKERDLRDQVHQHEKHLLNRKWAFLSIPVMGVMVVCALMAYFRGNERKELQTLVHGQTQSLRLAKERAEAENLAKTEFVARVNHEIRNPLTVIVASSELLADELATPPEVRTAARESLAVSTRNLLEVIDHVLDFTKIESGKLNYDESVTSPQDIVDSVCSMLRPQLQSGVEIISNVAADVPQSVLADGPKIRQVLLNFCQNAVRHTNEGSIQISCATDVNDEHDPVLVWQVKDSGTGMSSERFERVFEPYGPNDGMVGSGLGLYICYALVKCMDGVVDCVTSEDSGTTMTFKVPLRAVQEDYVAEDSRVQPPLSIKDAKVLLVDDEPINQDVLKQLLQTMDCSVETAGDWPSVEPLIQSQKFHCVLMDLRMPGMDGFEMLAELKKRPSFAGTKIYAMTGDATENRVRQAGEAGFDGFLAKPVTRAKLYETLCAGQ